VNTLETTKERADTVKRAQRKVAERVTATAPASRRSAMGVSLRSWLSLPVACVCALLVHWIVSKHEPEPETLLYFKLLGIGFGLALFTVSLHPFWPGLKSWLSESAPIVAAVVLGFTLWELATSGFRILPLPYFPSPAGVMQSLVSDASVLFDSTWHSLILLMEGYLLGVAVGLVSGICIGWFPFARYWGMPLLKIVGPIPATAWIPLAMVVSPSAMFSAVGLIALAVWFPVTMLTASGISNTRASYLDVARTLGAGRAYLIFRVAIPAAMPSIFIGLFMGLGASFLTLIVAETVGVKSGLGWYVSWAQGWAEYGKVYAALMIMAVFFSTIMTVLFKVRDRVLVWQKGVIKW